MLNPIKLASNNFLSSLDTSYEEFLHILEIAKNFKNKDLNIKLKEKVLKIKNNLKINSPTIPSVLDEELECNIFLKAEDIKTFSKLRDLKDNF